VPSSDAAPPADELASDPSRTGRRPLGRRERKKIETRRKIFRVAFELFALKGFDGTTVQEIAQRAGVAKGTVFNYFPHKAAFLLAAHHEWIARLEDDLGPPDSWTGSARDRIRRVLDYLTDLSIEHRDVSRMVIFESMRDTWLRMGTQEEPGLHDGVRLVEEIAETVIRQGKKTGDIRRQVDEEQAASLIVAATFSTLVRWLVKGGSATEMKEAVSAKLDIIFTGLAP
jgi:AcrR family transcriptional regulator